MEAGDCIQNHGVAVDLEKKRVKCNYCGKEVPGFNRLKHHLAAVGTDVLPCDVVPGNVKECLRTELLQKKKDKLIKEVGELVHPELPLRRKFVPVTIHENGSGSGSGSAAHTSPSLISECLKGKSVFMPKLEDNLSDNVTDSSMTEDGREFVKEEIKSENEMQAARCIGMFFCENGIDPKLVQSASFQTMVNAIRACAGGYRLPTSEELGGWILQEERSHVQLYVDCIKSSWAETGCSLLLDSWIDTRGRNLISFLVDCPNGTIFLRSVDASVVIHDVDALVSLLSSVIEEVGAKNVVQVISNDASPNMEAARHRIESAYRHIFWALCADCCLNLILEKIANTSLASNVIAQAKNITSFMYSHALPLELMRRFIGNTNLVKTTNLKYESAFLTLQNLMSKREKLIRMFNSRAWNESVWPSRYQGKLVAGLINNQCFWSAVNDVLKLTQPILRVLRDIHKRDKGAVGFIYDAMDRAKEEIKSNVGDEEAKYLPIWTMIDDIWNDYLHSPLHAAGYYLNPSLFYSNDFFVDHEVTTGLVTCTVRMTNGLANQQDLIAHQLNAYGTARDAFADEIAVAQRNKVSPALWWILFGCESPELQHLAVRILNQSCSGSARFSLSKKVTELVHAGGRNCIEQQRWSDVEFINNNIQLHHSSTDTNPQDGISSDDVNPLHDWFVGGSY
ncbi:Ribonuclease H-like protein [Dioscorea alata]|uniref:Ribonuclease H-like protein n=1 Tax=Dioscorea alata TaxID=55571 RepID=A0ACB7VKR6_DIOAL|nr:Ribonuclease H-like protein [Dioscorea alata]